MTHTGLIVATHAAAVRHHDAALVPRLHRQINRLVSLALGGWEVHVDHDARRRRAVIEDGERECAGRGIRTRILDRITVRRVVAVGARDGHDLQLEGAVRWKRVVGPDERPVVRTVALVNAEIARTGRAGLRRRNATAGSVPPPASLSPRARIPWPSSRSARRTRPSHSRSR